MHRFEELIQHSAQFSLDALQKAEESLLSEFETSASTSLVKAAQMIQLQKAISAVGMFSIFDAELQSRLGSADGFLRASEVLDRQGKSALSQRFSDYQLAVNVLKHGRGRSYDLLVKRASELPFRIKLPNEAFFFEGDVSEVSTLIEVDNDFVRNCANVIWEVSRAIEGDASHDA